MGGLQARIVPYSKALSAGRIDAEFSAHPMADELEAIASRGDVEPLLDLANHISSGHTPYKHDVKTGDVGFVTVECVSPMEFHEGKLKAITAEQYEKEFSRQRIKKGDVLCTIKRRICQAYPWLDAPKVPLAINQDVALLRPKTQVNAAYLAAYLSSSVGQGFADRQKTEQMNPYISLVNLKAMPVVVAGHGLQMAIEATVSRARESTALCETLSDKASSALLTNLGLSNWAPPEPLTYSASSADAFASGRLDAQYFMPAKIQVQEALRKLPGRPLGERFASIRKMMDPKKDTAPPIVRNYDVTDALQPILDDEKEPVTTEEIGSTKKVFKNGDVAISRLRAYLREIAVVRTDGTIPSVGSSEFIVLRPKTKADKAIAPETLLTFLRSAPVQTILKWCQDGSQHPRFSEDDLLAIHLPDAVEAASAEIAAIVQEGFAARRKARALLDAAKRAVEIAIEDSEEAALAYLDKMGAA